MIPFCPRRLLPTPHEHPKGDTFQARAEVLGLLLACRMGIRPFGGLQQGAQPGTHAGIRDRSAQRGLGHG